VWHRNSPFGKIRLLSSTKSNLEDRPISILTHRDLLDKIPLEDVRTFCFIAHVDAGKSSLASRVLELAGNLGPEAQRVAIEAAAAQSTGESDGDKPGGNRGKEQIELLDTLSVEKERGITVKASAATMLYRHPAAVGPEGVILLNMVDTPGHSDFGLEVARSLLFVQGAILLIDAAQGIQAQTWSVYEKAKSLENPPELLLALTKVDLDAARPVHVALSVSEWLNWDDPDAIIHTSARSRRGVADVLDAVCRQVKPPQPLEDDDGSVLRAQVVDSWYDSRGVNCLVQIVSGGMAEGDRISIAGRGTPSSGQSFSVQEVGIVLPKAARTGKLGRGQMGYVRFGLKDPRQAQPGTILVLTRDSGKELTLPSIPETLTSKSVLYASVHPMERDGFDELSHAVDKLALNDTGLEVSMTASLSGTAGGEGGGPFLGPGLRVGFQGLLHVEVFRQRLIDEFGFEAIVTPPKVPYTITFLPGKNSKVKEEYTEVIEDLAHWPEQGTRFRVEEPMVKVRVMAPVDYAGNVMELIKRKRGIDLESKPIDEHTWMFEACLPWGEVVTDFHDELKNLTAGYGSLDTSEADPPLQEAALSKVDIMLNSEVVEPLAFVCHKDSAQSEARAVCKKLQEVLPRQQFVTVIQAKADGRIIASERIRAYRKDVLTTGGSKAVGGGDISRKKKLLEKQKKGKKRQQGSSSGRVVLSQAAFNSVISRSS
jgi:elongation factor 4